MAWLAAVLRWFRATVGTRPAGDRLATAAEPSPDAGAWSARLQDASEAQARAEIRATALEARARDAEQRAGEAERRLAAAEQALKAPGRDGGLAEVWWSPGEACFEAIARELEGARRTIDACVFTITDDRIVDACALSRGFEDLGRKFGS